MRRSSSSSSNKAIKGAAIPLAIRLVRGSKIISSFSVCFKRNESASRCLKSSRLSRAVDRRDHQPPPDARYFSITGG